MNKRQYRRLISIMGIALISVAGWSIPVSADAEDLVINELMAVNNRTVPDENGDYDDWIEIANPGSSTVNLAGLALTDDLGSPAAFVFPDVSIDPGGYLIVWADDEPDQGDLHAGFKLTSGGESVYLLDGATIVDSTNFPALGDDVSWGRWPDGTGDWKIMGAATPGSENRDPEPPNVSVYLNEVMADNYSTMEDPQEAGEYPDWIEIFNGEEYSVDLGGMFLSDDASDPNKFEIAAGVTIPAHGYLVFIADNEPEQGPFHTTFKLSSSGDSVYLFSGGFTVDETTFGILGSDISWGRYPDGTGSWKHLGAATPGAQNEDPQFPSVKLVINEFMADNTTTIENPDAPGQYSDWIEIYNGESEPVDMGGMYLSDEAAEPTKYPIPAGVTIPAGGYVVFWADDQTDLGPLHTNFKLAKSDEIIYLIQSDGSGWIDSVAYGAQQTDVSWGRYPDGTDNWSYHSHPTPGSANLPETSCGMTLFLDDRHLSEGDAFNLYFTLWPDSATYVADAYVLMDVYGLYFSWPQWTTLDQGLGSQLYTVYPGNAVQETVLGFTWPSVDGSGSNLFFYGAVMRQGTYDIIGDLQVIEFSYE